MSEVNYLHEVCQPALIHTTGIVLQMRASTTSLVMSFAPPARPSSWRTRHNLKLDTAKPSAVWRMG